MAKDLNGKEVSFVNFIGSIVVAIGIIVLSVGNFSSVYTNDVVNADKVLHYFMYLIMAVALGRDLFFVTKSFSALWWILTLLLPCVLGGMLEIIQSFIPCRSASWIDMAANAIGAVIGTAVVFVLLYRHVATRQQRFRK